MSEIDYGRIRQWRESGEYLPEFMRDFHDQKDLFKALQDVVDRANEKKGDYRSLNASWTEYHIYSVDIFLWVMAGHGYTLQRTRKRLSFPSIYEFVSDARQKASAIARSILFPTPPAAQSEGGAGHE